MSTEQQYKPGDVANGHVLGTDGQWRPATDAPAAPKKSWVARHKVLTGIGGAILAIIVISAANSGGDDTATAAADPSVTAQATAETAESVEAEPEVVENVFGTKVRDGKFEFTVTGMKCGIKTIGDKYVNTKAQGEFCRIAVTVENIGDEAQAMFASNQTAYDAKGRKFESDSTAGLYDNKASLLFEDINPGNTAKGNLYFDMPKGVKPVSVELHDSMLSGGVQVALKK
jgi:hypothetical protein